MADSIQLGSERVGKIPFPEDAMCVKGIYGRAGRKKGEDRGPGGVYAPNRIAADAMGRRAGVWCFKN